MKGMSSCGAALVWLAAVGCCVPGPLLGASPTFNPAPPVPDVALADGGLLQGQVVDAQGAPLGKTPVSVWQQSREVARTATDNNGYFAVRGLRGGAHRVIAANNQASVRLWKPGTAPPTARQALLVVTQRPMVRGQYGGGGIAGGILGSPLVVAGVVAAAVAVPVAVHNASREPVSP